jgi:hypothetical protein
MDMRRRPKAARYSGRAKRRDTAEAEDCKNPLNRLKDIRSRIEHFSARPAVRRGLKGLRFLVAAGVIGYLVHSLSSIGWSNLLREMPRTLWFYLTVVVMYFLLPVFETLVYRSFLPARPASLLSVFIRKKVLNMDLMGYSGEVFFLFWVKEKLGIARARILRIMIDMGLTSSMGGVTASGLLVGFLLFFNVLPLDTLIGDTDRMVVLGSLFIGVVLGLAAWQFRHTLFKLPPRTILMLYGAHILRFMTIYVLQILQWWVVLPDVPFVVWGTMLAIWTVTNRLPFLMTRDLVAIALILELPSVLLGGVETAIASMLLTRVAADRVLGISLFIPLSLSAGSRSARIEGASLIKELQEPEHPGAATEDPDA